MTHRAVSLFRHLDRLITDIGAELSENNFGCKCLTSQKEIVVIDRFSLADLPGQAAWDRRINKRRSRSRQTSDLNSGEFSDIRQLFLRRPLAKANDRFPLTEQPVEPYFHGGLVYFVTNHIQLDIHSAVGLNRAAADLAFTGAGFSIKY